MATILLVEDEAVSRLMLTQFLTSEGFSVESVANGDAAVKAMRSQNFDAVISDYTHLGKLNGMDVLTEFERLYPGRAKLLMTAHLPGQKGEQAIGAIHVAKPVQLDDLLTKLKDLLAENRRAATSLLTAQPTSD
jgi:DNA-binding NtrC family response regulator